MPMLPDAANSRINGGRIGPLGVGLGRASASGYDSATTALFARMSVAPDATRAGVIDTYIRALKTAGVWNKLEVLYLLAAHDAQAARLNLISASFNATAVATPTFTTDAGYAGDGSTSYLSTGWTHSASAIALQDSTSFGFWINAGPDSASQMLFGMGALTSAVGSILNPRGTTNVRGRVSDSTTTNMGAIATNRGFTAISRTSSNLKTAYRAGSSIGTSDTASSGRSSDITYLCAYNNTGILSGPMSDRFAMGFIGAGLSSAEILSLYNATNTYLTAIGAQ